MSTANSLTSGLDCASPESILEPSNRTAAGDQYSLGCVLYFCLTGRYPFPEGTAVQKMMAHQTMQPPPIGETSPDAPEPLVELVNRLMQKSPELRFPSWADVLEGLRPFADPSAGPRTVRSPQAAADTGKAVAPRPVPVVVSKVVPQPAGEAPAPALSPAPNPALTARVAANGATRAKHTEPDSPPEPVAEERPARPSLEENVGPVGLISWALLVAAFLCLFWQFMHR